MSTTLESPPNVPARTSEEDIVRAAKRRDRITTWGWRIAGYVFFLGIWELASGNLMDERLLPGPSTVFETFGRLWASGEVPGAFATTLSRIAVGFAIAFVVGVAIGILMQNRFLNGFFRDAVTIGVTTPGLIWALITAIIFGNRTAGPIIAIVLTTFALITVNIAEGIKSLPKDLIDMGKSFDVGVVKRNRHIVVPHLAPFIFTGVRFGFSIAWKVTVLTEVFAASQGIGFEMRTATQLFRLDEFLTWILAFYVLALFLDKVVLESLERRFFAWRGELKS
ncbi:ABC transporter permease [Mycolicibacterium smegmatis]|uniref:ABC nitrate/sulfonate/bicarbonate family protein transporter, inner membrane subunit, putative n=1 Tax=Mycolicibacterium smegmatis (strain MKD8) TaxID=1214915 RepID=A0A2U9PUC9_MYCSE|nr:ABC transporter permease [Mycolicibacterium smegmatis]AWT55409.1 ABC nitrate/sulfonate/bicarbonate family protein transporter, inner membrane subunit, putative [Mycolicibacterium smegmatis MKD8]UGU33505.1 ABC transporter permease [Mycolicibacterium smegmatis]ULN33304.1 ABC transporter permease [Mycolicibacterium smegmatis]ULN68369.1 ABC transporter permease [Mycolicibacterium smegmatis]